MFYCISLWTSDQARPGSCFNSVCSWWWATCCRCLPGKLTSPHWARCLSCSLARRTFDWASPNSMGDAHTQQQPGQHSYESEISNSCNAHEQTSNRNWEKEKQLHCSTAARPLLGAYITQQESLRAASPCQTQKPLKLKTQNRKSQSQQELRSSSASSNSNNNEAQNLFLRQQ